MSCVFCQIVTDRAPAAFVWRDAEVSVFADLNPIREGHVQIVPNAHFETFEQMPAPLAARIMLLGQRIARAQKRLYAVHRVGFVYSGHDVAHAHAHVLPLHDPTDVTSLRYFEGFGPLKRRDLCVSQTAMSQSAERLKEALA